jgi:hypothetical protein
MILRRSPLRILLLLVSLSVSGQSATFTKQVLTDLYFCDGVNAGDINRDGYPDVVAGPYWYEGPEMKIAHAFYPPHAWETPPNPTDSMFSYLSDFNSDGWLDILVFGRVHKHEAFWYENPGKALTGHSGKPWEKHFVFHRIQGESPLFEDVDGDGEPEIVTHTGTHWGLVKPDKKDPYAAWTFHPITEAGTWEQFYHGTGVGDINGDQRLDLILSEGWYEQPGKKGTPWTRHEYLFSTDKGGAQMFAYDVDGDGDNDIITSLNAHGWGLAWFEQVTGDKRGSITFKKHMLMGSREEEAKYGVAFSQPHALAMADIDGDGLQDIITGKRRWAHGPEGDIEPNAAPVIYWFQLQRSKNGSATFVPKLIDDESGLGVQITVQDIDEDSRPDVLATSKLGTFVFRNQIGSR